jgi:hypothetical protein
VPPLADREFEYAVPCVPEGRLDVVMLKAVGPTGADAAATVRVTVAVAVLSVFPQPVVAVESVTLMPKEKLPLEVGVPEIVPVFVARLSPVGSLPLLMLQV